jgi:hypothetical protein
MMERVDGTRTKVFHGLEKLGPNAFLCGTRGMQDGIVINGKRHRQKAKGKSNELRMAEAIGNIIKRSI